MTQTLPETTGGTKLADGNDGIAVFNPPCSILREFPFAFEHTFPRNASNERASRLALDLVITPHISDISNESINRTRC